MTPAELMEALRPAQEKKGFFFNPDREYCLVIMAGLLKNKERYGYSSCPCRLATRERERDRDIICPCVFREEDVRLYDRCFCDLYISEAARDGKRKPAVKVPDRWVRD